MKQTSLLIALFLLASYLQSCSNNTKDIQQPRVNSNVLPGVWEYRFFEGGLFGQDPSVYQPGNGRLWAFTDSLFQYIDKDSVYYSGTYSISHDGTDPNTNRQIDKFTFSNYPDQSFELRDDTLRFYNGPLAGDGTIQYFVKIADDTTGVLGH